MVVLAAIVELDLHDAMSLKDKRGALKSLIARLHREFNVAAAEVALHDAWHSAAIGLALVSTSAGHAESMLERILRWIELNRPDLEIAGHSQEILHFNVE
ncbi:MAG: DUF503 domain-containing protein [Chloroflexota bacterium]|jgi:uncharacterized protein YlxP (DUF503 family)|nr:DUF503 domain-containing protein [Aggregatilineaceae bacterium]